jgi:hypothetical protein
MLRGQDSRPTSRSQGARGGSHPAQTDLANGKHSRHATAQVRLERSPSAASVRVIRRRVASVVACRTGRDIGPPREHDGRRATAAVMQRMCRPVNSGEMRPQGAESD